MYVSVLSSKYIKFYAKVKDEASFEAVVVSSKKESEYYNSYTVKGKTAEFKNKKFILYLKKGTELEYGDRIKINGEFFEPEGVRNYKGFSYKKYLQTEKIYGTIKTEKVQIISKNNTIFIFKLTNNIRNKIIEQIKKFLPEETSGLLIGLMIGDKTYISDEVRLDFQKSSLAHILAVSGAHVSYVVLGITYINSINKMPKKSGYILTICILIVFIFITNFAVSVIRACIMSIILILSKLLYRKANINNTIIISILIILIFNPYSINSASLQLSYLGTIGVIYVAPVVQKFLERLIEKIDIKKVQGIQNIIKIISVPIAAQITILPVMVRNFNTISLTFLISNIVAMPLLGICIIGGYLLTIVSFVWLGLTKKIGIIFNIILKTLLLIAKSCGNLKLSNIYVITPNTITIIIYYIVVSIIVLKNSPNFLFGMKLEWFQNSIILPKAWQKKIITIILVLIILLEIPWTNYNGKLKIYFIDVGQRRQYTYCNSKRQENINRWWRNRPKYISSISIGKENKNFRLCCYITF